MNTKDKTRKKLSEQGIDQTQRREAVRRGQAFCEDTWMLLTTSFEEYEFAPFLPGPANLSRLLDRLLLHSAPCLVSICLKPTVLLPTEEKALEERMAACEKYHLQRFTLASAAPTQAPAGLERLRYLFSYRKKMETASHCQ